MEENRLLVDVAVILAAAFPMLFLGRWLWLSEVISYLVTGVVIGPHALGWIRGAAEVEAIAEVGVAPDPLLHRPARLAGAAADAGERRPWSLARCR